mgnify:CR=1 FL=1
MDKVLVRKNTIPQVVKGCLIALSVSVIGILVFAVILRFLSLNDLTIKIVNQIIKVLSVLLGVMVTLKKDKTKGLIKGSIVGVIYTLSSYLLFSILVASFSFGLSIVYDMLFSGVVGLISGVIFVNSKK